MVGVIGDYQIWPLLAYHMLELMRTFHIVRVDEMEFMWTELMERAQAAVEVKRDIALLVRLLEGAACGIGPTAACSCSLLN